jgi:hypothetical protein
MVRARHLEIQKIERDFMELAQMFTDLEQLVVQQDNMIEQIDNQGEQVATDVVKANEEIKGAIDKARARNRKKWWCLLICSKCSPAAIILRRLLTFPCSLDRYNHRGCRCRGCRRYSTASGGQLNGSLPSPPYHLPTVIGLRDTFAEKFSAW